MISEETSAGVYFLGNGGVLDWSIGLLESLRFHNPDIPLALIPYYDDRIDQIAPAWLQDTVLRSSMIRCCFI